MKAALKELFERDLIRLKREIELYQDESIIWNIEKSIKNSAGNLSLHLIGNLKAFIGAGLADSGYLRDRDFEFAGKDVSRANLYKEIDETIEIVKKGLDLLTVEQLSGTFPIMIWNEETSMPFTLIHLYGHLNYHLGQINYHRRLLDNSTT